MNYRMFCLFGGLGICSSHVVNKLMYLDDNFNYYKIKFVLYIMNKYILLLCTSFLLITNNDIYIPIVNSSILTLLLKKEYLYLWEYIIV